MNSSLLELSFEDYMLAPTRERMARHIDSLVLKNYFSSREHKCPQGDITEPPVETG